MYSASADLLVNRQHDDTQQGLQYNDQQADVQIINTYKDIITRPIILNAVVKELNSPRKVQVSPAVPAELLSSARMDSLVEWMRNNYDVVVLDVPPVMAVTDAHVLMPLVDGAILVTIFGKTLKINLERTVETLRLTDTKILGIVQRVRGGKNDAGYGYGNE